MASYAKDNGRIRINAGNNVQLKFGGTPAWNSVGHVVSGFIDDSTDEVEVVLADGDSLNLDGKRKVTGEIVLAQSSKDEMELIDVLRGSLPAMYIDNGEVDSKYQEFYFTEVKMIPKMKIEMKGNTHQTILFSFSAMPQAAVISVTPSTGLPADAKSHATATPVAGLNKYYVIIETAKS